MDEEEEPSRARRRPMEEEQQLDGTEAEETPATAAPSEPYSPSNLPDGHPEEPPSDEDPPQVMPTPAIVMSPRRLLGNP